MSQTEFDTAHPEPAEEASTPLLAQVHARANANLYPSAFEANFSFGEGAASPSEIKYFLRRTEVHFLEHASVFTVPAARFWFFYKSLRGKAWEWIDQELTIMEEYPNVLPRVVLDWPYLRTQFEARFGGHVQREDALLKLTKLSICRPDLKSVVEFNATFNNLAQMAQTPPRISRALYTDKLPTDLASRMISEMETLSLADVQHHARTLAGILDRRERNPIHNNNQAYVQRPRPSAFQSSTINKQSNIIGTDGKLLEKEKQRRVDGNLCLVCGSNDHKREGCPKARPLPLVPRRSPRNHPTPSSNPKA